MTFIVEYVYLYLLIYALYNLLPYNMALLASILILSYDFILNYKEKKSGIYIVNTLYCLFVYIINFMIEHKIFISFIEFTEKGDIFIMLSVLIYNIWYIVKGKEKILFKLTLLLSCIIYILYNEVLIGSYRDGGVIFG